MDNNKILKDCQLCGKEIRTYFKKKKFCKSCREQLHNNIMALLTEEELTGSPAIKAMARRLYEENYTKLTS